MVCMIVYPIIAIISNFSYALYDWGNAVLILITVYCDRKGKHHLVRSQSQWGLTSVTWSLCLRWSVASLVSTMERPSIKLKLSLKWLVTIWLNSQSLTSLLSTVGLVLVPLTPPGLFLSSEDCHRCPQLSINANFCLFYQTI